MNIWEDFHGSNAGYVLELYDRYQQDPLSVDPETRKFFDNWTPDSSAAPPDLALPIARVVGAVNLANSIRWFGHLDAQLDPLGIAPPPGDPSLDPAFHGISNEDLRDLPASLIGGPIAQRAESALDAIEMLRAVHSYHTGFDFDHVHNPEEREWLAYKAESAFYRPPNVPIDRKALLRRLTEVEVFENFLHRVFPGKSRFSIEGLDMLVPMLDEVLCMAADAGINRILIGMAHRGRLNVLAHVLNKSYAQILAEFKDPVTERDFLDDLSWTGDVKYHRGASRALGGEEWIGLEVSIAPNPSHLEHVNPVVQGMARAAASRVDRAGPPIVDPTYTLPIVIHGDAAFPGQGINAETLNLSRLNGYMTGGTIHIITNNQLGFTTTPTDARSTLYASDLAKGFEIPILHVNADDPEACIEAARIATAYRMRFKKDFVIDLIGYRRHGHNEGDEPFFTQPRIYRVIEQHPTVRQIWADALVRRCDIIPDWAEGLVRQQMEKLQHVYEGFSPEESLVEPHSKVPPPGAARRVRTQVPLERLVSALEALMALPEGFTIHPKLEKGVQRRIAAAHNPEQRLVPWGMAEELAFATVLEDKIAIRLTGEDVERGTFNQRHAVYHDYNTGERFVPLQNIPQARAAFEICNSPLTENAALGFEFGYNIQEPSRLVLWEAQYGDFINTTQAMIDEFLVSARAKWGQTPSLVLLLPHGYEGQGPDHSSARLERFLQLAADTNMRIAYPTTAAQYFHLLRRQALLLKTDPLPLIVMSPKSLLRHPATASSLKEIAERQWQPVLDDPRPELPPEGVRRLVFCSGKIAVDMLHHDGKDAGNPAVAVVRLEQLYPFPRPDLEQVYARYPNLQEVVWLQEEPENMGAWEFARPRLNDMLGERMPLNYMGRYRSASPAEGSHAWHVATQRMLLDRAWNVEEPARAENAVLIKTV
ncbi:MAG TPA: 2-oxoglutarate dehydrogenase E1 component [Candidatus Sumerlaeota bacterium]|nr:2-oxoglutarate dehydrogenase E1 component [Candidatus Sumerlaeota bacterium]HPK01859.1 2-oxoglutarate dehydrogenase E1 component [Candidatus Sumerlaeota bacterium]